MVKKPILKPFGKDRFELVEAYQYKDISVPKGYKTNGADIPRLFWNIFPPNKPKYLPAVILHDYLCDKDEYKKADAILKEMMQILGCSRFEVFCFYWGCKIYHIAKYRS